MIDSGLIFSQPCNKVVELTLDAPESVVIHQGGTSCFAPGTRVVTKRGTIPIEDVVVGDMVLTMNEVSGEKEWKPVRHTYVFENEKETVRIRLKNGHTITCTSDHEFFYNGRWVSVKEILSLLHEKDSGL